VMGGRDSAGNALNDIWKTNTGQTGYKPGETPLPWIEVKPEGEVWKPRCLFRPVGFNDQIWVYGGVKEPFSKDVYSDLWVYPSGSDKKKNSWEKLAITDTLNNEGKREPIASCVQVFRNEIYLLGTFRELKADGSGGFETWAFRLASRTAKQWTSKQLERWASEDPFSVQAVNFQNKYLMAKALVLDMDTPTLQIYIDSKVYGQ
jgi:hypothetical protein